MTRMDEGTPLSELPPRFHNSPSVSCAYTQILNLERNEHSRDRSDRKRLMYARILGYLILEGPSDDARVAVALEVSACNGEEEEMLAIGRLYFDHYIRACKLQNNVCLVFAILESSSTVRMNIGPASVPSSPVSPSSFNTRKTKIMDIMVEGAPLNHRQAKANVNACNFGTVYK